jgi:hypothetical protein
MKQLLGMLCALMLGFLCNNTFAQKAKKMHKMNAENISYPYTASLSSDFAIGNPQNSKMILDLWKDYDENAFDRHADWLADTVVMFFPDGSMLKGKDSVLAAVKSVRGSLSNVTDKLVAWVPLKMVNNNENWVALWGNETDVLPDGKTVSRDIQEVWRINKDGKVDFMKQYESKPPAMQQ